MDLTKLKEPFPADKIHWRVGATTRDKDKGIALAYIDARDVMQRLDEVCGPENWQCEYPFPGCCRIGIRVPSHIIVSSDDELHVASDWIWKSNGAGETDYEGTKGQYSDAFKRAAVLWGVGQYLYDLPNEWVPIEQKGKSYVIAKGKQPALPKWALPGYVPPMDQKAKHSYVSAIKEALSKADDQSLSDIVAELTHDEQMYIWRELNSAERGTIKQMLKGE